MRGLEALTLSIPPTPGHAVPVRKNNKGFQTVGGVLKEQGYEPIYLYGGYSYFDNMSDFFGGNGYTVIDRGSLARDEISHETIWGVADEDLFTLTVREIDARAAAGRKVFAHVMTTSNHRPFTYPSGRIDIPSGSGRDGAVKYSDWAIGELMRQASTRSWYKDTLFVFVADHTSRARGNADLPPDRYHIPLIFYAPNVLAARTIETVASQIDVGPTMLALLNVSYTSRFFGQDILTEGQHHQRALMANYLTVGQMKDGIVVELSPKRGARVLDAATRRELPVSTRDGPPRSIRRSLPIRLRPVCCAAAAGLRPPRLIPTSFRCGTSHPNQDDLRYSYRPRQRSWAQSPLASWSLVSIARPISSTIRSAIGRR